MFDLELIIKLLCPLIMYFVPLHTILCMNAYTSVDLTIIYLCVFDHTAQSINYCYQFVEDVRKSVLFLWFWLDVAVVKEIRK